jgi:hypothetical protein
MWRSAGERLTAATMRWRILRRAAGIVGNGVLLCAKEERPAVGPAAACAGRIAAVSGWRRGLRDRAAFYRLCGNLLTARITPLHRRRCGVDRNSGAPWVATPSTRNCRSAAPR